MYDLNRVGEHTYYIDGSTNLGIYIYNGNKACMIDGGSDDTVAEAALNHIRENDWQLQLVLATHCHADHTCGCAYLAEQTGCKVYAPGADSAIMTYSYLNPTYLFGGFPAKDLEHKFTLAPACETLPITEDILPPGLSFIHVDGHSFEQLAFKTSDDVWFMADSVVSAKSFIKYKISFLYDINKHINTLERVRTLEGRLFIPSHCPPMEDIRELALANLRNTYEVAEDIKRLCRDGLTMDELLEKLFDEYKIRLYIMQYALVGYTARSYLSWLYSRGEVLPEFVGTKLIWKTA